MAFAVVCLLAVLSVAWADPHWIATYNGPYDDDDEVQAIGADDSGNVVVSGFSTLGPTDEEFVTVKYRPGGDTVWLRHFNPSSGLDGACALAVDRSGNVIVTGYLGGSTSRRGDWVTIEYSPAGESLWAAVRNIGDDNLPSCVVADSAGNSYVTGRVRGSSDLDMSVVKYGVSGSEVWVFNYNGGSSDNAQALAVDGDGCTYVTGYTVPGGSYGDLMTWKLGLGGESLWASVYAGPAGGPDEGTNITVDGSGSATVSGISKDSADRSDFVTIKYASDGDTIWTRRYNGAGNQNDQPTGLVLDAAGNAYVTGGSYADDSHCDYTTIKYAPDGTERWVAHYPGVSHRAWAYAIALDTDANVYVTGRSFDSLGGSDAVTVSYDSAGNQRWAERHVGLFGGEWTYVLTIGPDGGVYAGGRMGNASSNMDYLTLKYGSAGAGAEAPSAEVRMLNVGPTIVRGSLFLPPSPVASRKSPPALLDISGRKVMDLRSGPNDVSRLSPGVYFMREQPKLNSHARTSRAVVLIK
jgi:hypothetical protein